MKPFRPFVLDLLYFLTLIYLKKWYWRHGSGCYEISQFIGLSPVSSYTDNVVLLFKAKGRSHREQCAIVKLQSSNARLMRDKKGWWILIELIIAVI